MANPGYEEKSSVEVEGNVISLVDYSDSSEDEDESPATPLEKRRLSDSELNTSLSHDDDESSAAPMKKQCLSDSELNSSLSHDAPMKKQRLCDSELNTSLSHDGFSNSDAEEEIEMESSSRRKPFIGDIFSDSELDNEDWSNFNTDSDLLNWGQYSWRRADRWNQREEYFINLAKSPREESKCMELLDEIGCGDRFLGCSVEMGRGFFAQLNKEEADKMRGLKEIRKVVENRFCVFDIS